MAGRKASQTRTDTEPTRQRDGAVSRRRALQLMGGCLAAATLGVGTAAAQTSTDSPGDSGSGQPDDRVPIGGGPAYDDAVTEADADAVATSLDDLVDALEGAAAGDVVFLAGDATVDLGEETISVPARVTLASNRGVDGSAGALLATESEPADLVRLAEGATLSGVRLRGANTGDDGGSSDRASGATVVGTAAEVENCEIRGFPFAGVYVQDGWGHVHHNVITECNKAGLGYGVAMYAGYNGLEYNYFNYNRHSVASDGSHRGYVCRYNHFGPTEVMHNIDAHEPGCELLKVHNNVVETVEREWDGRVNEIVKIDGVPDEGATVRDNWFFNSNAPDPNGEPDVTSQAIVQGDVSDWENFEFSGNAYGADADVSYADVIPGYSGWRTA